MLNESLFSSRRQCWETPDDLFARLDGEFHFTLDVCALPDNAKVSRFFTPEDDGLKQDWTGHVCWMNPPYGRDIVKWVRKAWHESKKGAVVVGLLPSRTDTRWWHDYVMRCDEIRFVKGRLRFKGAATSAPFPSCIAIWKGGNESPRITPFVLR